MKKIIALIATAAIAMTASDAIAVKKDAYTGSRIFWDFDSRQQLFDAHSNYARIIQLQDGRIMVACEGGGGISVRYSSDYGDTWTTPERIATNENMLPFAVPDLIQLKDGTIIVGFNPRPSSPYSEDRRFGCRCVISEDNGKTWTDPITIYDAHYTGEGGCWEPSFLELPSGEIHCYFADESDFMTSNEQCISVCRSFDKGKTWSERSRVCFRSGARDGMPVPILTEDGEIIVIIEDNGWPGKPGFRATTVRCTLEDNWSTPILADSPNREIIFQNEEDYTTYRSAAPYLRQLPTGETIASWQGDHWDRVAGQESTYDMYVAVGDKDARNFKAVTAPFDLDPGIHSLWNSVVCVGDGSVIALGSIGGANAINMIKGRAYSYFEAEYGTPKLDGSSLRENYTTKMGKQIYMGSARTNKVNADFLYDHQNLYFTTRVADTNIYSGQGDADYIELFFDFEDCCDTFGQKGMFQFRINLDGTVEMKSGNNNRWTTVSDTSAITALSSIKTSYYEVEVAFPWSLFGYDKVPTEKPIRFDFRVKNFTGNDLLEVNIPDAVRRQSWSWMELKLREAPESALETTVENDDIDAVIIDNNILVTANSDIKDIALHSLAGVTVYSAKNCGTSHNISTTLTGGAILQVTLADGRQVNKKILL